MTIIHAVSTLPRLVGNALAARLRVMPAVVATGARRPVRARWMNTSLPGRVVTLLSLRERGYRVFHDLVGDGFNVDHVLIGPTGVFTVETKTWRKPTRGEARIRFDGETLTKGSYKPDRDPVVQALAQARWLQELLAQSTGRKMDVRPVIVFPGWFIEQRGQTTRRIWVLNPKALPNFLDQEPRQLPMRM